MFVGLLKHPGHVRVSRFVAISLTKTWRGEQENIRSFAGGRLTFQEMGLPWTGFSGCVWNFFLKATGSSMHAMINPYVVFDLFCVFIECVWALGGDSNFQLVRNWVVGHFQAGAVWPLLLKVVYTLKLPTYPHSWFVMIRVFIYFYIFIKLTFSAKSKQ